ncbi:MAG: choice-of-anchor C family protein [Geobacteraceae bacterium]|nr:choice-of-anchor C family protein [Geobacteraceae bacterium]
MKKLIISWLTCMGIMVCVNVSAEASLITNGSFEDGNYSGGDFVTLTAGSGIPGWDVVSGSIDWIGPYWQASDGSKSLDLAGYYAHGLILGTQFATEVGKTYRVQFDMAGNPDKNYSKSLVAVSMNNVIYEFTFDQAGHTRDSMGWETKSFDFVASDSLSQLGFGDITTGSYEQGEILEEAWGAALDNVRVDLAPVPEPSTILLLGAGLACFGVFSRRSCKPGQK